MNKVQFNVNYIQFERDDTRSGRRCYDEKNDDCEIESARLEGRIGLCD